MNKTANFQLTQWEKTDRIMMEDFNRDNAAIDAALKANADGVAAAAAALENCGNCRIVYGTYTGNGKYGSDNPNTLTFNGKPVLVLIRERIRTINNNRDFGLRLIRDSQWVFGMDSNTYYQQAVTWGAQSVSWYALNPADGESQFNKSGNVYCYVALLASDE